MKYLLLAAIITFASAQTGDRLRKSFAASTALPTTTGETSTTESSTTPFSTPYFTTLEPAPTSASVNGQYVVKTTLQFADMTTDAFANSVDGLKEIVAAALEVVTSTQVSLMIDSDAGDGSAGVSVDVSIQTDATQEVEDVINSGEDFVQAINDGLQASKDAVLVAASCLEAASAEVVKLAKYMVKTTIQFAQITAEDIDEGLDDIVSAVAKVLKVAESSITLSVTGSPTDGGISVEVSVNTNEHISISLTINGRHFLSDLQSALQEAENVAVKACQVVANTAAKTTKLLKYLVKTTLKFAGLAAEDFIKVTDSITKAIAKAAKVAAKDCQVLLSSGIDIVVNGTLSLEVQINTDDDIKVSAHVNAGDFLDVVNWFLQFAKEAEAKVAQAVEKTEALIVKLFDDITGDDDVVPADDIVPDDSVETTTPPTNTAKYIVQTTLNFTQMTEEVFADSYDALKDVVAAALDVLDTDVSLNINAGASDGTSWLTVDVSIQTDATDAVEDLINAGDEFIDAVNAGLQATGDVLLMAAACVESAAADVVELAKYMVKTTLKFVGLTGEAFVDGLDDIKGAIASVVGEVKDHIYVYAYVNGSLADGDLTAGFEVGVQINTNNHVSVSFTINEKNFLDKVNDALTKVDNVLVAACSVVDKTAADVVKLLQYLVKTTLKLANLTVNAFEDGMEDVRKAVADAANVAEDVVSLALSFSVDVDVVNGTLSVDASINTNDERSVSRTVGKDGFLSDVNKGLSKAKNYLVSLAQAIQKSEPLVVRLWDDATGRDDVDPVGPETTEVVDPETDDADTAADSDSTSSGGNELVYIYVLAAVIGLVVILAGTRLFCVTRAKNAPMTKGQQPLVLNQTDDIAV